MLRTNQPFAFGFFQSAPSAVAAVQSLLNAGFESEHVGVLMLDGSGVIEVQVKHKTEVGTGIAVGMLLGAVLAAVIGPSLGLLAFSGVAAHFAAAAVGGAAGALLGAVGGMGFWSDVIKIPRQALERGDVLVGVLVPEDQVARANGALEGAGAASTSLSTRTEAETLLLAQRRAP
jgi:uncharacterized membrane protein